MAFCKYCGNEIPDEAKFCPSCGASQAEAEEQKTEQQNSEFVGYEPLFYPPSGKLKIGYLVWSILNMFLSVFCCFPFVLPLAIVGLVMTVTAQDARTAQEEERKLGAARGWNLAATITSVSAYVIAIAYVLIISILSLAG